MFHAKFHRNSLLTPHTSAFYTISLIVVSLSRSHQISHAMRWFHPLFHTQTERYNICSVLLSGVINLKVFAKNHKTTVSTNENTGNSWDLIQNISILYIVAKNVHFESFAHKVVSYVVGTYISAISHLIGRCYMP